ncbi:hypothetical protein ALC62_05975 [Cyphomyrmex costatus]|uniref:Uncharacterized protein n=1 Tax=Cyphomyrmex costatus TaxID=456900 RepID=A0A195CQT9_9HYME|nr:hypothetical protein ALC62_05975 [Cyphomyrmex costatus]
MVIPSRMCPMHMHVFPQNGWPRCRLDGGRQQGERSELTGRDGEEGDRDDRTGGGGKRGGCGGRSGGGGGGGERGGGNIEISNG